MKKFKNWVLNAPDMEEEGDKNPPIITPKRG